MTLFGDPYTLPLWGVLNFKPSKFYMPNYVPQQGEKPSGSRSPTFKIQETLPKAVQCKGSLPYECQMLLELHYATDADVD